MPLLCPLSANKIYFWIWQYPLWFSCLWLVSDLWSTSMSINERQLNYVKHHSTHPNANYNLIQVSDLEPMPEHSYSLFLFDLLQYCAVTPSPEMIPVLHQQDIPFPKHLWPLERNCPIMSVLHCGGNVLKLSNYISFKLVIAVKNKTWIPYVLAWCSNFVLKVQRAVFSSIEMLCEEFIWKDVILKQDIPVNPGHWYPTTCCSHVANRA